MKKIITLVVLALITTCNAINAQKASAFDREADNNVEEAVRLNPNYFQNKEILDMMAPQDFVIAPAVYDKDYNDACKLRNRGRIMTIAGGVACVGFVVGANLFKSDGSKSTIIGPTALSACAVAGGGVAIAGIVMWITGQRRMKEFRPSANGLGLALEF